MNLTLVLELADRREVLVLDLDPALPNEATVLADLQAGHLYEPDVTHAMMRILRPGDTMIDVGVNAGFFTILGGRLVGPEGRVIGLEPDPRSLERLPARLQENGLDHATILPVAASDRTGSVTFHLNTDNSGGSALWDPALDPNNVRSTADRRTVQVQSVMLDDLIPRLGDRVPRLIKIDTEGAEHAVLSGALRLLRQRPRPFVIAELHGFGLERRGSSQMGLRRCMAELGYDCFLLYRNGCLPKLLPSGTVLRSDYTANLLFTTPDLLGPLWPEEVFDPLSP